MSRNFWLSGWMMVVSGFFAVTITPQAQAQGDAPQAVAAAGAHPLDSVLKFAEDGLERIRREVKDYSAILVRRERIKGKLGDFTYLDAKIRNRVVQDGKTTTPFAVSLNFLKPASLKGREVVWIEGKNNGKMWVQESPVLGLRIPAVWILPNGSLAMSDNKYPITDIGIENLLVKLIDKGKLNRGRTQPEDCDVKFVKGAKIDERPCTMISLKFLTQRPGMEFERAEIFVDDELQVPVRYAAYLFPEKKGEEAPLEEEYTYTKMKLNIGLTDKDFTR